MSTRNYILNSGFAMWETLPSESEDKYMYVYKLSWSFHSLNGLAVKRQRLRAHLRNVLIVLITNGKNVRGYRAAQDVE